MSHSICPRNRLAKPRSWLLLGICLLSPVLLFRLAGSGFAETKADPGAAAPDSCVLHLDVVAGTTIKIDGRDFGARRRFVFDKLDRSKPYQARVELHFPGGRSDSWLVPITAGRVLRIGIESPASRLPQPKPNLSAADAADGRAVAEACNALAFDLFGELAKSDGNLVFSPASLGAALTMISAGAAGQTHEQMIAALHLPLPGERSHAALSRLLQAWNHDSEAAAESPARRPYELTVASSAWVQPDVSLQPDFVQLCKTRYGSSLQKVDFRSREAARTAINVWVARQTHGKIAELLSRAALPETTRLVLTNAIHFKGKWAQPFDPRRTVMAPFQASDEHRSEIAMMRLQHRLGFYADADLQVLELPYAGDDLSLVVLLPTRQDGIESLGKQLSADRLAEILARLQPQLVDLNLPKFRLESQFQLRNVLAGLGMNAAFSSSADFSGISRDADLQLSDVIHKTEIELNEEGTEADAATGVVATVKSMKADEPIRFLADHPFVFLVRDRASQAVLFMGRIVDPKP